MPTYTIFDLTKRSANFEKLKDDPDAKLESSTVEDNKLEIPDLHVLEEEINKQVARRRRLEERAKEEEERAREEMNNSTQ